MAKKTIISDFSALKGKVTFSDKTSDAKMSPKVTAAAAPKPKESDKVLKSGHYRVYTILFQFLAISESVSDLIS